MPQQAAVTSLWVPVPAGTAFTGCCDLGLLDPEERKGQKCKAISTSNQKTCCWSCYRMWWATHPSEKMRGCQALQQCEQFLYQLSHHWQNTSVGVKRNLLISAVRTPLTVSGTFDKEVHTSMDHALQHPAWLIGSRIINLFFNTHYR